jgi:hypothetical protein
MSNRVLNLRAIGVAGALALAGAAFAQPIVTFTFNDLNGGYAPSSATAGVLSATGSVAGFGTVAAQQPSVQNANYNGASTTIGRFNLNINVSVTSPGVAIGSGTLTIVDSNNDTITAAVSGNFQQLTLPGLPTGLFFNGLLANVLLNNISGDGNFNGPSGGLFPLDQTPAGGLPPYSGAVVRLQLNDPSNFFQNGFSNIPTQVSGQIVPAPASIALMGLGALVAGRRRR